MLKKILLICGLLLQFLVGQDNDQLSYTTYYFNDSGNSTVVTSSFSLAKKIISGTAFLLDIELDKVTLPPVDGATGASRPARRQNETFEKNRGQIIIGAEQSLGATTTIALNAYRSQEMDYLSNAVVATFSQELFQRNTTITLKGQYNDDKVGELTSQGGIVNKNKNTITAAINITQILSQNTVLNLGYDFMQMEGFLSDPYRQVITFDNGVQTIRRETHPDSRIRHAATTRISQFLEPIKASIIADYRYYFDDWDMNSHTFEGRMNKYIFDNFIIGFNYRYYSQSAAEFFNERYDFNNGQTDDYFTADYKLSPFNSSTFGFNFRLLLRLWGKDNPAWEFLNKSSFDVMYLRYTNDLDFSANILQATLNFAI
jgi:hypothetical protein